MIPPSLHTLFATLQDNDVVRIGTLRELLEADERADTRHWVEMPDAVLLTGIEAPTLRARARQWEHMARPPVRVTRKGASKSAHFLFDQADCIAYRRRDSEHVPVAVSEADQGTPGDDSIEATEKLWTDRATRNLRRPE